MFFRSGEELRTQKTLADKQISPLDVEGRFTYRAK